MQDVSPGLSRGDAGLVRLQVRVAIQVGPGPVITHRGARIGVAGSDLDIPEIHACIEHRGDMAYLYWILRRPW
jgi:hypothetical protein